MKPAGQFPVRFSIVICLMLTSAIQTHAQWSTDPAVNNAISTAANYQFDETMVSDGSGGAIITWEDGRGGAGTDIYVQKINAAGVVQWTTDGIAVSTAANSQSFPVIVSDGSWGAIIAWADSRNGIDNDIYAQRIDASGTVLWDAAGVEIVALSEEQNLPVIAPDGSGGAIIAWQDSRGGVGTDIYAQRINSAGVVQWNPNGVTISSALNNQFAQGITSDGLGGAIITWMDGRSGPADIYTQKINASGTVQWTSDGVAICTASNTQTLPTVTGDGSGGAIITWYDYRNGIYSDIYAQKVSATGIVQWTTNGVDICTASGHQFSPVILSDGSGGAIIAWDDIRSSYDDVYAQRISSYGVIQWTFNGVPVTSAAGNQLSQAIISNGTGGAVIVWTDDRNGSNDIYAQNINSSGTAQWTTDGVPVSKADGNQTYPTLIADGTGGAIVTWKDQRTDLSYSDLYAQRIDRLGNLYPEPWIDKVGDIANDQGGKLRILWRSSPLDVWGNTAVKSYTIKMGAKSSGLLGKTEQTQGSGIYWQTAGSVPADWSEAYSTAVQTFADSGLQGMPYYYFQVIAKNSDSTVLWTSNIDSAYSVDNIPPVGVGGAFIGSSSSGDIALHWNKNRVDKDLMGYVIHRSTTSGVMLNQTTKIVQTVDTSYVDTSTSQGNTYYYKIAAIDNHGNVGSPSQELSQSALALELSSFTALSVRRTILLQWKTVTEINNSGFEIERRAGANRSLEGNSSPAWTKAGFVEGNGTSNLPKEYYFTDKNVSEGTFFYRLKQIDRDGKFEYSRSVEVEVGAAPNVFELSQNYPNPFNPSTTIEFTVPSTGRAALKVFNPLGQEVATLYNDEAGAGKYHLVQFNASGLASGLYFSRLEFGGKTQIKKMVMLK